MIKKSYLRSWGFIPDWAPYNVSLKTVMFEPFTRMGISFRHCLAEGWHLENAHAFWNCEVFMLRWSIAWLKSILFYIHWTLPLHFCSSDGTFQSEVLKWASTLRAKMTFLREGMAGWYWPFPSHKLFPWFGTNLKALQSLRSSHFNIHSDSATAILGFASPHSFLEKDGKR